MLCLQSANHSHHLCRYRDHLDNAAKLVETGVQTMEESEMAIFLQVYKVIYFMLFLFS